MKKNKFIEELKEEVLELISAMELYDDIKRRFSALHNDETLLKMKIARKEVLKKALKIKDELSEMEYDFVPK